MTSGQYSIAERLRAGLLRVDRRILVAGEMGLAALLGFVALGHRSLWLDESVSVTISQLDWSTFVHVIKTREGNMSLYHLLMLGWIKIGDSEFAARSLSVLAGVATIPAAYTLTKRLAGLGAALLAAFLLALNPLFVQYAQQARGYELCLLLVTVAAYLFVRGIEQPTWWVWTAYAVVSALAAYTHFFALLVPPAHALSLFVLRREVVPWRKIIGAGFLLLALLTLLFYLLASNQASGIEWAAKNPIGRIFTRIHDRTPLAVALLVVGLAVVLVAGRFLSRRLGTNLHARGTWVWSFVLAWLLVPFAVVAVLAVVYRPLFVIRYFIVCLPPAVILASMLVMRIRRPALAAATAVAIAAVSLLGVGRWYATGENEDWRSATHYVLQDARSGDGLLFYAPYVRIPFSYYLDRQAGGQAAAQPVYPAEGWKAEAIRFDYYVPVTADRVRAASGRFKRVWLVLSHVGLFGGADTGYQAVLRGLASAGFAETASRSFRGVKIVRYKPR